MDFIALKPCCFAGQKFKIGETVPGELVLPERAKRLVAMGRIAEVENPVPTVPESENENQSETTGSENENQSAKSSKKSRAKGKESGES